MHTRLLPRLAGLALAIALVAGAAGLWGSSSLAAVSNTGQLAIVMKGYSMALSNPTVTNTTGTGDSNPTVIVQGQAVPGSLVQLYSDQACTQSASTSSGALASGLWSVVATVAPPQTSELFYVRAVNNALQQFSNCVFAVSLPGAPLMTGTNPQSSSTNQASNLTPVLFGNAPVNSTVRLFTNAQCNEPAFATAQTGQGTGWSVTLTVSANTTTTYWGRTVDSGGDVSACSSSLSQFGSVTYFVGNGSASIFIAGSVPASPSTNPGPIIYGGGAVFNGGPIRLFTDSICTQQIANTVQSGGDGSFVIDGLSLGPGTTNLFVGQNASNCSTSPFQYTLIGQPSQTPQITSVTGSGSTPTFGITGAPPNSIVFIYSSFNGNNGCNPVTADGQGFADNTGFATVQPEFPVTSPTTFWPNAQINGNFTPCGNGFFYSP